MWAGSSLPVKKAMTLNEFVALWARRSGAPKIDATSAANNENLIPRKRGFIRLSFHFAGGAVSAAQRIAFRKIVV